VQLGTQRRSWPNVREAIEKMQQGAIGKVHLAKGWYANNRPSIGRGQEVPPPEHLDWNLWQGPAPRKAFRDNYVHYNWHWFWHWGNGEVGNNGIHALDVCRWGLGVDFPKRVSSGGGRYFYDDDQETPDSQMVALDFGDKLITWEGRSCQPREIQGNRFGIAFYGTEGTLVIGMGDTTFYDLKDKVVEQKDGKGSEEEHVADFLSAIRTGQKPRAEIETGYRSTLLCLLGAIAHRTGHTLNIDPTNGHIVGDPEAEKLWSREYEPGWEPKV
ncbi:MAG: Gfo/Idh/MocA family protein, partial [Planctomycetota bacterium]